MTAAAYGPGFYGEQLELIRAAVLQPGETTVDVVALSLPGQHVVVAATDHPERFGRIVLVSPTGFGRFKGSAGRTSGKLYRSLRVTGIGRLLFAVLARRQVIRWFLRQIFADPGQVSREYELYCWRACHYAEEALKTDVGVAHVSDRPVRRGTPDAALKFAHKSAAEGLDVPLTEGAAELPPAHTGGTAGS